MKSLVPSLALTLMAGPAVAAQAGSYTLHQDRTETWSWDSRLAAGRDPTVFTGFSRRIQRVEPGWWGTARGMASVASHGAPYRQPGEAPVPEGASLDAEIEIAGAYGPVFVRIDPEVVVGFSAQGRETLPNPWLNDVWTGAQPAYRLMPVEPALRASVGIVGLKHALVVSSEPFQWGEGIFGGIVVGRSWKGFPHVALMPEESWELGAPFDIPMTLRYEVVAGLLVGQRPVGTPEHPAWLGTRLAWRWGWTTLSGTIGCQAGGSGKSFPSLSQIFNSDTSDTTPTSDLNRMLSVGLAQWLGARFLVGVEYGIDDWYPNFAPGAWGDLGKINGWHPLTAAWTATIDWVDVTGSGDWRIAVEWNRSEAYFYSHGTYGSYNNDNYALAHADAGNANAVRLLVQAVTDEGTRVDVIASWRRVGWRNREDGNLNDRPGRNQSAARPWDTYGGEIRTATPVGRWGDLLVDLGLSLDKNYLNGSNLSRWNGLAGVGWQYGW